MRDAPLTENGNVYGLIGSGRDVTDRKARETAVGPLHEATRELVRAETREGVAQATAEAAEEVLDFPLTAVRLYDPETDSLKPVAMTDATARLLGERPAYERGEALPWRAFESGEPVVLEGTTALPDGLPVRHRMYLPLGEHGTLSIAAHEDEESFDDTDVRLAEVLATNAAVALSRVERETQLRRYERMLDTAGDSIYSLDAKGRFTAVNDTLVSKTGYAREELLGEHASMVLEPDDAERGRSVIRSLLSRGSSSPTARPMRLPSGPPTAPPSRVRHKSRCCEPTGSSRTRSASSATSPSASTTRRCSNHSTTPPAR